MIINNTSSLILRYHLTLIMPFNMPAHTYHARHHRAEQQQTRNIYYHTQQDAPHQVPVTPRVNSSRNSDINIISTRATRARASSRASAQHGATITDAK